MRSYLDFENRWPNLEAKVEELRAMGEAGNAVAISEEINRLESKASLALQELYSELTPWQKTQVARHPQRPHCLDYIAGLVSNFIALAGDRKFGDDAAIVGGFGRFRGESVCIIGHEKGSDTESRLKHNFGMARPEGYRKAVRLMDMADRFGIPVISLVDTAGAYPGIGAEERGQAEAIARSTETCFVTRRAERRGDPGRRRFRRGDRNCCRQSRADAGTRDLQRDLAGRRGLDFMARYGQGAGGGDQHEDHRAGHGALRRDRQRGAGTDRGAHRDPQAAIAATGEAIATALTELQGPRPRDGAKIAA